MLRRLIAVAVLSILLCTSISSAQRPLPMPTGPSAAINAPGTIPLPPGAAVGDDFGSSVAIEGAIMAIGAPDANSNKGAVHIYTLVDGDWTFSTTLTASDGAADDNFGEAVALTSDGANTYLLVSATGLDIPAGQLNHGGGYLFIHTTASGWTQDQKLLHGIAAGNPFIGNAAALTVGGGEVNAFFSKTNGQVQVFRKSGAVWDVGSVSINPPVANENFGRDIAASGTGNAITLAVGAPAADAPDFNQGAVYVYTRSGAIWSLQDTLLDEHNSEPETALLGFSVAIAGTGDDIRLIAGAPNYDNGSIEDTGTAVIFGRSGTTWFQDNSVLAMGTVAGENFGQDVAFRMFSPESGLLVILAENDSTARLDDATVHVYALFDFIWNKMAERSSEGAVDYIATNPVLAFGGDRDNAHIVVTGPAHPDDNVLDGAVGFIYRDLHVTVENEFPSLSEADVAATATITFGLNQQPTSKVTVTLLPQDFECKASPTVMEFKPGNWDEPRLVTVTAIDDTADGSANCRFKMKAVSNDSGLDEGFFYNFGGRLEVISATITDNDSVLSDTLLNADFEDKKASDPLKPEIAPWVVKNGTGDKIKCGLLGFVSDCAFVFKGSLGEASNITQTADLSAYILSAGHALGFDVMLNSEKPLGKMKFLIKVSYTDGTETTKGKRTISGTSTDFDSGSSGSATLASSNVKAVKITISNLSLSGKIFVDRVRMTTSSSIPHTRGMVPAAPPVPDTFRRG